MPIFDLNDMMDKDINNTKDTDLHALTGMGSSVIVLPANKTKEEIMASKKSNKSAWKTEFYGFTENTTLHGVRFIFMENVFFLRRAVWLLLFSLCSVLMMVQIVERIIFFYHYPMTVNVQVNYNKTLAFPAVTICNQNAFRATAAADKNLYRLLEAMHDSKTSITNSSAIYGYGAENHTLEYLYLATHHREEDMIVACKWQDHTCGPENFTEVLTDHGVCFTFNDDVNNRLWATSAGSDYGLRLTLNVEQYEYMPGPHNAAGVKILLHDQNEFPKVAELGLAIPTGSHSFVGIQMSTIENLPAPHGSCRSMASPFYTKYTPDACQMSCSSRLMQKVCGCRHFYLPHVGDKPPVCTLEQYYNCYTKHIDEIKAQVRENCDCPVPCTFLIYDPTISFATISSYATEGLLATSRIDDLRTKYYHAKDTTARMDRTLLKAYTDLEKDVRIKFESVRDILHRSVKHKINYQKIKLLEMYDEMKTAYENKTYLIMWQEFHVRKNFVRARDAMEERTLSVIAHGYQEFAYKTESRIAQIAAKNGSKPLYPKDVRTAIFLTLANIIGGRVDLCDRALQNVSELYSSYEYGAPIFRYQYNNEDFLNNSFITPKPLLEYSLTHNELARNMCNRLPDDIQRYKQAMLEYLKYAKLIYKNENLELNVSKLHEINVMFLLSGRSFYHAKSVFFAECIEYPIKFLLDKHEYLKTLWRQFQDRYDSLLNKIDSLLTDIDATQSTTFSTLQRIVYLNQNFTSNLSMTKLEIARIIISESTLASMSNLKNFMSKIRLRGQGIYDDWVPLVFASNEIWSCVLGDKNLREFYIDKNMTEYLQDYETLSKEVSEKYSRLREECDFRKVLENQDSLFLDSLQNLIEHMNIYHDTCQLDSKFIQENFLQLDLFYREKSYEQITQQRAYDMFALLCDIGGSMGLFVGASFLTLYEILDFGVHQCLLRLIRRIIT